MTIPKSEKMSEKKLINPDSANPACIILKTGIKATIDPTSPIENITSRHLRANNLCSVLMRRIIRSKSPAGGSGELN